MAVAHLTKQTAHRLGGHHKVVGGGHLAADVAVQAGQAHAGQGHCPVDPLPRRATPEAEAELGVVVAGGDERVRGRGHAGRDPQHHRQLSTLLRGDRGDPFELVEAVRHDRAHPQLRGAAKLGAGLAVAVEHHALHREAGALGGQQLAVAGHVDSESLAGHQLQHAHDTQGLGGIDHRHVGAERLAVLAHPRQQLSAVHDVQRRAVVRGQRDDVDTADRGQPTILETRGARPGLAQSCSSISSVAASAECCTAPRCAQRSGSTGLLTSMSWA
jgi:hypothetical protein